MNNIQKLKELEKIDYNLSVFIRKHKDVLMSVPGATENSVADLIINRIGAIINNGDNK
tara:strand:- start:105 stop:278 length:174 start_codon:yes stop_codon:yes gene_type:complete